ncbi:MAG: hypothetical protein OXD48_07780 [Litoreibacter sp.]|nr:hypothetical protein [Litoreibacter sp.]
MPNSSAPRRFPYNPFASLSSKLAAIAFALGAIAAAIGFMSFSLFGRISEDMDVLANEKVPETQISLRLSDAVNAVKSNVLEIITAATPQDLRTHSSKVGPNIDAMLSAAEELSAETRNTVAARAANMKTTIEQLSETRLEEFTRTAELEAQSEAAQELSVALQNLVAGSADDANFNIFIGAEEAADNIEATLHELTNTKFDILQKLLETRAEINLLSGLALASSDFRDSATTSIFVDLARSGAARAQRAVEVLSQQDQVEVDLPLIGGAIEEFVDAVTSPVRLSTTTQQTLLSTRQAADAAIGSALDEMLFNVLIAVEDANEANRTTVDGLMQNDVAAIMTLLDLNNAISAFQVSAIGVLSAPSVEVVEARYEVLKEAIAKLASFELLLIDENSSILAGLEGLADPETGIAANRNAVLISTSRASQLALNATTDFVPIIDLVLGLVSERQQDISSTAFDIAETLGRSKDQLTLLLGVAAAIFVSSLAPTAVFVTFPLKKLSTATERLASGDMTPIDGFSQSSTEIVRIAKALSIFRQNLVEKDGLEEKARKEREATEAEQQYVVSELGNALVALSHGDLTTRLGSGFQVVSRIWWKFEVGVISG